MNRTPQLKGALSPTELIPIVAETPADESVIFLDTTRSRRGLLATLTTPDRLPGWVVLFAGVCALAITFAQSPGLIVTDTKLPLIMSPWSFMGHALHLWNPNVSSGSIQTLSFGYTFPMGAFFLLGHVVHAPVWTTERVWLALLLTTGFWGMVRLGEAMRIGNRFGRVVGAVAYIVAPIVVTWAATTAALLAVVLLPWVLVPLVRGAAGGSPRRAALASGLAVALMGGVNSTVVVATLPVGALWLATREPGPRRRSLTMWWLVALLGACFWWAAALAIQSRYSFNYLPYTETSSTTTATASLFEAIRGTSYWTDHFDLGGPLIPGAWTLVSSPAAILGTSVVAALGLAGLARVRRERLFLVTTLALSVAAIAIGYSGPASGPLSGPVQTLLGGPFALFRNVSKISPDVALPLALGVASLVSKPICHRARRRGASRLMTRGWKPAVAIVAVAAIVLAATPVWQARLYPTGGFSAIPSYWGAAARWLDTHQDHGTALLVPAASFGVYTWGRTNDEPLSVLMSTGWSVRSLVPVGSKGNDQLLDAVESSLDRGVAQPGTAAFLARSGFDYVVVRNDLNLTATGAPPPAQVDQVLSETSGLKLVASFGPRVSALQNNPSGLSVYNSNGVPRSVLVYRIIPNSNLVRTYSTLDPAVVSGSVNSLPTLLSTGLLTDRAAILAGDPEGGAEAAAAPNPIWLDTDGNQRRDMSYGTVRYQDSYLLGPHQRSPIAQPQVPQNLAVVPGTKHQTVSDPIGAAAVSASSFGSTALVNDTSAGPAAAFDANLRTAWVASDLHDSIGQWVRIQFDRKVNLRTITLLPLHDGAKRPTITRVEVSTQQGSVERSIRPGENQLGVPAGRTDWLRITLTAVTNARFDVLSGFPLGAGLTSVGIPGVQFEPAAKVPSDELAAFSRSGTTTAFSFSAPLANANFNLDDSNDDDTQMIRRFRAPRSSALTISGQVSPVPGPALSALLPAVQSPVQITSSSMLGSLPRFAATNLVTRDSQPWIAGQNDTAPSLTFTWSGTHDVDALDITPTPQAAAPRVIIVTTPVGSTQVRVPAGGGVIHFTPMLTDTLTVEFVKVAHKVGRVPAFGASFVMPVGLKAISIPALGAVHATAPSTKTSVELPCGQGPTIALDGQVLQTAVFGTTGALVDLQPMALRVCNGSVLVSKGQHLLEAGSANGAFKVTSVVATPSQASTTTTTKSTPPHVRGARIVGPWGPQSRTVKMGPGGATYLTVAQNFNAGWQAKMYGRTLQPVRLDGWEQAWVVPAGGAALLTLSYTPDSWYRDALLLGALLIGLLAIFAVLRFGRRDQIPVAQRPPPSTVVVAVIGLALLGATIGLASLVFVPLALLARRWGSSLMAPLAFAAFVAAGVVAAFSPGTYPGLGVGAFGAPAQLLAGIAIAAVLASLIPPSEPRRRSTPGSPGAAT